MSQIFHNLDVRIITCTAQTDYRWNPQEGKALYALLLKQIIMMEEQWTSEVQGFGLDKMN